MKAKAKENTQEGPESVPDVFHSGNPSENRKMVEEEQRKKQREPGPPPSRPSEQVPLEVIDVIPIKDEDLPDPPNGVSSRRPN